MPSMEHNPVNDFDSIKQEKRSRQRRYANRAMAGSIPPENRGVLAGSRKSKVNLVIPQLTEPKDGLIT